MKFFTILFLVTVACAVDSSRPSEAAVNSTPRKEEIAEAKTSTTERDSTTIVPVTSPEAASFDIKKIVKTYAEYLLRYLENSLKPDWKKTQERQQRS